MVRLKTFRLLKILRQARREQVGTLTFIEISKPAALLFKWRSKEISENLTLDRIKPRDAVAGPVLNLSDVRNDKGEVISLDIYQQILALRRYITEHLVTSFRPLALLADKEPLNFIRAYIGLLIAQEIRNPLYLANYGKWQDYPRDREKGIENILVIPGSPWIRYLAPHLEGIVDRVLVERNLKGSWQRFWRVLRRFSEAVLKGFPAPAPNPPQYDLKNGKIMVTYATGLLPGQRNDISYFHAANIHPSRLLVFFRVAKYPPLQEELDWIAKNNISCISAQGMKSEFPGIPSWTPSPDLKTERRRFARHYLKSLFQALSLGKKHSWWFLDKLWKGGMDTAYWKDFFGNNKVSVYMNPNPSEFNFIPDLAMSEIGGLVAEAERSIRFDYCTYIHNPATHIDFITGPYSLTQVPERPFGLARVQTGALNVMESMQADPRALELKKKVRFLVTVFDESANDVFFGSSIRQLYRTVVDLVKGDDRFGIYLKTKKDDVLANMPDIQEEIKALTSANRCLLSDWKVSSAAASVLADIVISVPSTAAFESVITGTRTLLFNPMRSGSRLFYRNIGLNRRIFEDGPTLIEAVKKFADGNDDFIGDCSDIAREIDPFRDSLGPKRIGEYLQWCLAGIDNGMTPREIIHTTGQRYTKIYGKDKLTLENHHE